MALFFQIEQGDKIIAQILFIDIFKVRIKEVKNLIKFINPLLLGAGVKTQTKIIKRSLDLWVFIDTVKDAE